MKTAISLPDELLSDADRLARKLGKNRSELFREAVTEYIARRSPTGMTDAINAALEAVNDTSSASAFVTEAARRALERSEW